jgi:hypothetical protein
VTVTLDDATAVATDYWAVDFDYQGRFCPTWRSFRTRRHPGLLAHATHPTPAAGRTTITVRLVDKAGQSRLSCHRVESPPRD